MKVVKNQRETIKITFKTKKSPAAGYKHQILFQIIDFWSNNEGKDNCTCACDFYIDYKYTINQEKI